MIIKIFNTFSQKEEELKTIKPGSLSMYVCGPTVYDRPHLGNARSAVVYDLFFRFFKKEFKGGVNFVRNITDVDDKINAAAKERKISIQELTTQVTKLFHDDMDALNVLRPSQEPRATEHISEMITMIEKLIKNGNAYVSQGHVLFDVKSYKDYGALSHRTLDELISGARVEIAKYKKDPLDFVLWKPADTDDDISSVFESPWGKGRPGWHIECSAMSSKYLGLDFDVHGGGADLQFPHHENEIAQSRCAHGGSGYAKYWIHNGFLTVNGEKMSKSLKNFITVRDLLDKGVNGIVIRYLLLSTHYRKPFDYNQKALDDAQKSIEKFYSVFDENDLLDFSAQRSAQYIGKLIEDICEFLADDLNTSKAFAYLHSLALEISTKSRLANLNPQNKSLVISSDLSEELKKLKFEFIAVLDFLGLIDDKFFAKNISHLIDENFIIEQIQLRVQAKANKDWALADKIRKDLLAQNIALEDIAGGKTIWKIVK